MQQGANWQPESSEEADENEGFQVTLQSGAAFVCMYWALNSYSEWCHHLKLWLDYASS